MSAGPFGTALGLIASGDPQLMEIIRLSLGGHADARWRSPARSGCRSGRRWRWRASRAAARWWWC